MGLLRLKERRNARVRAMCKPNERTNVRAIASIITLKPDWISVLGYVTFWGQSVSVSISLPTEKPTDGSALILASYNGLIIVRLSTMKFPRPAHPLSPRDSHGFSISAAVDQTLWQDPRQFIWSNPPIPHTHTPWLLRAHHGEPRPHLMEGLFVYQTDPQLCPRWLQGGSYKLIKVGRTGGKLPCASVSSQESSHSGDY